MVLTLLMSWRGWAAAQQPQAFAEVGLAPSRGVGGGPYHSRNSIALMAALGVQPHSDQALTFAAHAGLWGTHGDDLCPAEVPSGCLPQFPIGRVLALTMGGRALGSSPLFELLLGPAWVRPVEAGSSETGLFGQLRFGGPPGSHVSMGLLIQAVFVRMDEATLAAAAVGASVRFW